MSLRATGLDLRKHFLPHLLTTKRVKNILKNPISILTTLKTEIPDHSKIKKMSCFDKYIISKFTPKIMDE